MPSPEVPLQRSLFSDELVDTRTSRQRASQAKGEQPQQAALFSTREIAQFGVKARPLLPLSPSTKIVLVREDPRTDTERELAVQQEAEERTSPLFGEPPLQEGTMPESDEALTLSDVKRQLNDVNAHAPTREELTT